MLYKLRNSLFTIKSLVIWKEKLLFAWIILFVIILLWATLNYNYNSKNLSWETSNWQITKNKTNKFSNKKETKEEKIKELNNLIKIIEKRNKEIKNELFKTKNNVYMNTENCKLVNKYLKDIYWINTNQNIVIKECKELKEYQKIVKWADISVPEHTWNSATVKNIIIKNKKQTLKQFISTIPDWVIQTE